MCVTLLVNSVVVKLRHIDFIVILALHCATRLNLCPTNIVPTHRALTVASIRPIATIAKHADTCGSLRHGTIAICK